MYRITAQSEIRGDLDAAWRVSTDVDRWPAWDPHERDAQLRSPRFEPGAVGWSKPHGGPATTWTVTAVDAPRRWTSECPLPGGKLVGENTFEPAGPGRLTCTKVMTVTGPLTLLFRWYFGPRIRRDMLRSFAALEAEIAH